MTEATPERYQNLFRMGFWGLLAVVTLVRLMMAGTIGLGVDESHYVMYARRLAWGYLDHPPLMAWLTAPVTLLGDNLFYYRLIPILSNFFSVVLLRRLALHLWEDERVAFLALGILTLLPYQHLLMAALLPDAPLNLFWCATLVSFRLSIHRATWWRWSITGILLGAALLSKYHAVLLPLCLGGYLLTSGTHRHWLKRGHPYGAALIALIVFSPNLIWNARNGWISYRFHLLRTGSGGIDPGDALVALGGQFGAWSPVMFGLLIAAWAAIVIRRPREDAQHFVLWTSLPVFAFFIGIGIFGKVLPHWTSPGWWGGSLALAAVLIAKISADGIPAARWRRAACIGAAIGLLMTVGLYTSLYQPVVKPFYNRLRAVSQSIHKRFPVIRPLPVYRPKYDVSNELFGWPGAAARISSALQRMPRPQKTFVFCHRFFAASQLGVYLPADTVVTTLGRKTDQYRLWFNPIDHLGWDALFVDVQRRRQGPHRYQPLFERVDASPETFLVTRSGDPIAEVHLYRYFNYRGRYQD